MTPAKMDVVTPIQKPIRQRPPAASTSAIWHQLLGAGGDGLWYFGKEYASRNTADTTAYRLRRDEKLPEGRWEFVVRNTENGGGAIWFRNLEGPLLGQDGDEE